MKEKGIFLSEKSADLREGAVENSMEDVDNDDRLSVARDSNMAFFWATLAPYFLLGNVADLKFCMLQTGSCVDPSSLG